MNFKLHKLEPGFDSRLVVTYTHSMYLAYTETGRLLQYDTVLVHTYKIHQKVTAWQPNC